MAFAATHSLAGFDERRTSAPAPAKTSGPAKASSAGKATTQGFFARLGAAFMESRQRSAEREIARHRHLFERIEASRLAAAELPFNRS